MSLEICEKSISILPDGRFHWHKTGRRVAGSPIQRPVSRSAVQMEGEVNEDEKCLHCRVDDLEDWLAALSSSLAWILLLGLAWLIYKSGILPVEVLHG